MNTYKLISILLCFLVVSPPSVFAQEKKGKVTTVKEGEKAPFDGTLFSPVALAKLTVEKSYEKSEKVLELQKKLEIKDLRYKFMKDSYEDQLKAKDKHFGRINKRNEEEIKFLRKSVFKMNKTDFLSGLGAGVGIGVVLTSVAGMAIYISAN